MPFIVLAKHASSSKGVGVFFSSSRSDNSQLQVADMTPSPASSFTWIESWTTQSVAIQAWGQMSTIDF
jgi:hypothetical protein